MYIIRIQKIIIMIYNMNHKKKKKKVKNILLNESGFTNNTRMINYFKKG